MALYPKAGQLEKLSTGEFGFYKVEKMSYIPFLTVFPPSRAYILNLLTEVVSDFSSILNNPFLWGSCNAIGHFIPSIVPRR